MLRAIRRGYLGYLIMQFRGYHINNLKSYQKYFSFLDAVAALENGAYEEWLTAISETMKEKESALSEDGRIAEEIRLLMRRFKRGETASQPECGEEFYRTLFLLFYRLAHLAVTDEDMEEINRLAHLKGEEQKKKQAFGEERTDAGMVIFITEKEYRLPVWRGKKERQIFVWRKLVNMGDHPAAIRIVEGGQAENRTGKCEEGNAEECDGKYGESRCLDPGGYAWMLTGNGRFVRWGRRVQVHQGAFACVDRKGGLTVNGYPMLGAGMVDFSFDRRIGILGVDKDGGLRQYSGLELDEKAGSEGKIAFACLKGKNYVLVKEDGTFVSNLTGDAGDLTEENICEMFFPSAEENRCELPFPAMIVSVSDQLIGFETPDSRVGVWDREQGRLAWMEGAEWNGIR